MGLDRSPEVKSFKLSVLSAMPVITSIEQDDLRYQDAKHRIWLSRRLLDEGADYLNQVTEEELDDGRWIVVGRYPACTERTDCSCPDCDTF